MINYITGLNKVLKKIKRQTRMQKVRFARNLTRAGLFLQRESQNIVPVDEGPLRASAFTRWNGSLSRPIVSVGYTAAYAVHVHENLDALHGKDYNIEYATQIASKTNKEFKMKRPQEQAKFLETPYKRNRRRMLKIIAGRK